MIPLQHREFAAKLLADHGVPELPPENRARELLGWTAATAAPQVDVALAHPKVRLIANALGTPPSDVIDQVHKSGRLVAALCGRVHQAVRHATVGRRHRDRAGHRGRRSHRRDRQRRALAAGRSTRSRPTPVLAAGGIGTGRADRGRARDGCAGRVDRLALAHGRRGRGRARADRVVPARDERGHRPLALLDRQAVPHADATTGPRRGSSDDSPEPLGMPLQGMVTMDAIARTSRYAGSAHAQQVAFNPVGQTVGLMSEMRSCREVDLRPGRGLRRSHRATRHAEASLTTLASGSLRATLRVACGAPPRASADGARLVFASVS